MFSCKDVTGSRSIILRDCSGTYIQLDSLQYKVCNTGKVDLFEDSSRIRIRFKQIDKCPDIDTSIVCDKSHPIKGEIYVRSAVADE